MPRSPRGPRPPPRPGENVYSGSSVQDGSCSASHRLTHTHTVTQQCYSDGSHHRGEKNGKKTQGGTTKPRCSPAQTDSNCSYFRLVNF